MTYTELKDDMLKRIDPAYASSTTYRAMAVVAFLEALKIAMIEMPEEHFQGFIYKKAITNVSEYSLSDVKTTELKDFVKLISIKDNAKVKQYVRKNVSEFEDRYIKPITALQNFYTIKEKKIIFYSAIGSTETANMLYFGIPVINDSDDIGQYLDNYILEKVIEMALPKLRLAIMGAE